MDPYSSWCWMLSPSFNPSGTWTYEPLPMNPTPLWAVTPPLGRLMGQNVSWGHALGVCWVQGLLSLLGHPAVAGAGATLAPLG